MPGEARYAGENMSKVIEAITASMSAEAAKEFKEAVKGMTLLDNSNGEYVNRGKADAERVAVEKERDGLKKSLDDLQAAASSGKDSVADLEKKLKEAQDAHKAEVSELRTGMERDKKTASVKQILMQAKAKDADIAFSALGIDLDKLDYDDKGNLVGLSDRIKALQEGKTFLFDVQEPKNGHLPTNEGNPEAKAIVDGALKAIGY